MRGHARRALLGLRRRREPERGPRVVGRGRIHRTESRALPGILARLRAVPVRHEPHQSSAGAPAAGRQEVWRQLPQLLAPLGSGRLLPEREQGREARDPRVPAARPPLRLVRSHCRLWPEARRSVGANQPLGSLGPGALRRDDRARLASHARDGRRHGRASDRWLDEGGDHQRRVHVLLVDALPRARPAVRGRARQQARRCRIRTLDLAGPARRGCGRRATGARARGGRGEEAGGEGSGEAVEVEEVESDEEAKGETRWTNSRSGCWRGSRWTC